MQCNFLHCNILRAHLISIEVSISESPKVKHLYGKAATVARANADILAKIVANIWPAMQLMGANSFCIVTTLIPIFLQGQRRPAYLKPCVYPTNTTPPRGKVAGQ
jgi:hypothetical protein